MVTANFFIINNERKDLLIILVSFVYFVSYVIKITFIKNGNIAK